MNKQDVNNNLILKALGMDIHSIEYKAMIGIAQNYELESVFDDPLNKIELFNIIQNKISTQRCDAIVRKIFIPYIVKKLSQDIRTEMGRDANIYDLSNYIYYCDSPILYFNGYETTSYKDLLDKAIDYHKEQKIDWKKEYDCYALNQDTKLFEDVSVLDKYKKVHYLPLQNGDTIKLMIDSSPLKISYILYDNNHRIVGFVESSK